MYNNNENNNTIAIVKMGGGNLLPQSVQPTIIITNSYQELQDLNYDYLIVLDKEWNFNHSESVAQLIKDIENNGYAVGIYSDSMIDNAYKNNLPFNIETLQQENIMSGILIRKEIIKNLVINSTQDMIKTVGQNYMLYRSPNILFKYES